MDVTTAVTSASTGEDRLESASEEQRLRLLLEYAVLAPSGHNTQPWLFFVGEDFVDLYADWSRALPALDPEGRELVMSCGAALFHLLVAARYFEYEPEIETQPDSDDPALLARVRLGRELKLFPDARAAVRTLFEAISRRHTSWLPFNGRPIPPGLYSALQKEAEAEGAQLHYVSADQRPQLLDILRTADLQLADSPQFRQEMEEWIGREKGAWGEGVPGYPLYVGEQASYSGPLYSQISAGTVLAEHSKRMADSAPLILGLSVARDSIADWLAAGRTLDRVLLRAAAEGVSGAFLNGPIQVADIRPRLQLLLGGGLPVILLGLGVSHGYQSPTPRRPLEGVVVRERPRLAVPDGLRLPPLRGEIGL